MKVHGDHDTIEVIYDYIYLGNNNPVFCAVRREVQVFLLSLGTGPAQINEAMRNANRPHQLLTG